MTPHSENQRLILEQLSQAVVRMDEQKAVDYANKAIEAGIDPADAIEAGLSKGMNIVGQKYEAGEYFIPQLLLCSDAMQMGMAALKPYLVGETEKSIGNVVIGVVEGDTHDIGKNIVSIMLTSAGFTVFDLGRDVPPTRFVEAAQNHEADFICLSSLMSATVDGMAEVVQMLQSNGIRQNHKVVIGGGAVSPAYAKKIGADGYASNAVKAVDALKALCI